jgi:serine/threonine protein kinase
MDFGRVGASWFLAMEYVGGMTLHAFMARGAVANVKFPPSVVGFLARSLLAGLDHAHQGARGDDGAPLRIVHRDLCPKNVLISTSGEVKISDFGVARALGDSAMAHTRVTGHVGYVAPEQARGDPVDVRADLFPVGVMMWELLTGQRLFARDNEAATLHALMAEDIPGVTSVRYELDPAWEGVIARALARDPNLRYASARQMAATLDAVPESRSEQSQRELVMLVRTLRVGGESTLDPAAHERDPHAAAFVPAPIA